MSTHRDAGPDKRYRVRLNRRGGASLLRHDHVEEHHLAIPGSAPGTGQERRIGWFERCPAKFRPDEITKGVLTGFVPAWRAAKDHRHHYRAGTSSRTFEDDLAGLDGDRDGGTSVRDAGDRCRSGWKRAADRGMARVRVPVAQQDRATVS